MKNFLALYLQATFKSTAFAGVLENPRQAVGLPENKCAIGGEDVGSHHQPGLAGALGLRPEAFASKAASLSAPYLPFPVPAVALVIAD